MKKTKFIAVAALAIVAALSSCQKESQVLRLDFEGPQGSNSKVVLGGANGRTPQWESGDEVNINSHNFQIGASGQVEVSSDESGYLAGFPAAVVRSTNIANKTVILRSNASQTYEEGADGKQKLKAPMVGYAPQGESDLAMKNVCSLAKVTFKAPRDLTLRSIKIEDVNTGNHALSGTVTVNIASGTPVYGDANVADGLRYVKLNNINKHMTAGEEKTFYLFMLKGDAKLKYTIRYVGDDGKSYTYTRQKSNALLLDRNAMGYLDVLDLAGWNESISSSVFSTNDQGRVVEFSGGNLQYNGATGAWQTAANQWDYISDWIPTGWVDKLGWGCWDQPSSSDILKTSTDNADYNWGVSSTYPSSWSEGQSARQFVKDFGDSYTFYNWRILYSNEWKYLMNTRTNTTVDGTANARYTRATVHGVKGMILFPDKFAKPAVSCSFTGKINSESADYSVTVSDADWTKLENAGCAFLPAAGNRNGTTLSGVSTSGYYWSATGSANDNAYRVRIRPTEFEIGTGGRRYGMSIRLVRNI